MFCREGYTDAAGALAHINDVGEPLGKVEPHPYQQNYGMASVKDNYLCSAQANVNMGFCLPSYDLSLARPGGRNGGRRRLGTDPDGARRGNG